MRKLQILTAIFATLLTANLAFAKDFSDLQENHENFKAIQHLSEIQVLAGYEDGTFQAEKPVNRAELLKIILGSRDISLDSSKQRNCFPDVREEWFAPYICYAKEKGWVSGYPDGLFRPANVVNRSEALKIIFEATEMAELQEIVIVHGEEYEDVNKKEWYAYYVYDAKDRGLIEEASYFLPEQGMTRGEVAEIIFRTNVLMFEREYTFTDKKYDLEKIKTQYFAKKADGTISFLKPLPREFSKTEAYLSLTFYFEYAFDQLVTAFQNENYEEVLEKADALIKLSGGKEVTLQAIEESGEEDQSWVNANRELNEQMYEAVVEIISTNQSILDSLKALEEIAREKEQVVAELCAKHPDWTLAQCTSIANQHISVGMTYEMLIELRGQPDSKNPSNYGYGTEWQWCWNNYTPMCFYDLNDDKKVDAYN